MKKIDLFIFTIIFTLAVFFRVNAQSAETIWLSINTTDYKTGEIVAVMVNAAPGAPVQGIKFQIRYDPACLQPLSATSPISGMNGSLLPQTPGLASADFASATPQTANGVLAEVKFLTVGECQTDLVLESAALRILNEAGFAAPLKGITLDRENIALNIEKELGSDSVVPSPGNREIPSWLLVVFLLLGVAIGLLITINLLRGHTIS